VWGTNIGGLFAAVGVTSIVIGLAVQTAVGPVIAGLLLLFEQPFRIGDWLDTSAAKGRVVEVNWRSAHIDTGNGIKIVPNAVLATGAFTNLSRVSGAVYQAKVTLKFSADDQPGKVVRALLEVAEALPAKISGLPARVSAAGEAQYGVSVPIASPADEGSTKALLLHRAWYAAQRAGLRLDDAEPSTDHDTDYVNAHLRKIAGGLGVDDDAIAVMSADATWLVYASGEVVQPLDGVPEAIGFIAEGAVEMVVRADDGRQLTVGTVTVGDTSVRPRLLGSG
jgi:small-conductance mechanosensitive channel